MAVFETDHHADVIYGVGGKPFILQMTHGILNAMGMYDPCIRHAIGRFEEAREGKSRNSKTVSQLLNKKIGVEITFPFNEDGVNAFFIDVLLIHFGYKVKDFLLNEEGNRRKK